MLEIGKFGKIIAANWKLNGSYAFIKTIINQIEINNALLMDKCVVIFPPSPYIRYFTKKNFYVGAQNCSFFNRGAYTGEISTEILKDIGCQFCIVGHSERRMIFQETNEVVLKKITNCLNNNIIPILCIGESLQDKKNHQTKEVLTKQISECIPSVANNQNLIIAYEPLWAIGTGSTPTLEEIKEIHSFIKKDIPNFKDYKVLYGGSVKSSNSVQILNLEEVDGVLVGGSSLEIREFNKIITS